MGVGVSSDQGHDDQEEDRPAVPSCAFPPPASLLVLVLTTPSYPLALPHPDQSSALSPHPCSSWSSRRNLALLPTSTPHPLPSHIHHAHIKARQLRKRRGREIEVSFLAPRTTIFDPDDDGFSLVWRAERAGRAKRASKAWQSHGQVRGTFSRLARPGRLT